MGTIIKLLIVGVIINGAVRVGVAASTYYQFKDESQQLVTFGGGVPIGELQNHILEKAEALEVPLEMQDVEVTRQDLRTVATAAYTQNVEVFPNYFYPIQFSFRVEGLDMGHDGRVQHTRAR